ncbi:phospholipase D-like domain-containing protein [Treponema brennaborense]|nr:phospholipase D-like domain-containing protein [Treponema brennaborense]
MPNAAVLPAQETVPGNRAVKALVNFQRVPYSYKRNGTGGCLERFARPFYVFQEVRMKPKWLKQLLRYRFIVVLILLAQICFFIWFILRGSDRYPYVAPFLTVMSLAVSLYIISRRDKGAFKLAWIYLLLIVPLFGGVLYVVIRCQAAVRRFRKANLTIEDRSRGLFMLNGSCLEAAVSAYPQHSAQMSYLERFVGFPVCARTEAVYYSAGESFLPPVLEALKKAEKYIFLEFFIMQEGVMWNSILEILVEKASQGVDVRVMYDDIGCFLILPADYTETLKSQGIKAQVFNPLKPFLAINQNNRDHRKIIAVDGTVAFTGGINIADEYIGTVEKHGIWKDSGVKLTGQGAWTFTLLFLQMWDFCRYIAAPHRKKALPPPCCDSYESYFPAVPHGIASGADEAALPDSDKTLPESGGFVQPYADTPMDGENVGEHVYLQLITGARRYIYITTPYLILDDSMISALILAAKSGVDVRVITPQVWDKRLVHITTRSYYRELIEGGVKIYEYTGGFVHAKLLVTDDNAAVVGTTNFDFRSLYHHFECGTVLYGTPAVADVKNDFLETVKASTPITIDSCRVNFVMKIVQDILRIFAPLM